MTREEEIINAAREYNNGITFSNPSNVLHFEAGAKWADKNPDLSSLWHDASEEPEGVNWEILCQDENDGCWVENRIDAQLLHKNWNVYTEIEKIVRWAYIKDLLPKGGEQ